VVAEFDQALVDRSLGSAQFRRVGIRLFGFPGLRSERAAFQRVDIEPVDDENMVEGCPDGREERNSGRLEFSGLQTRDRGVQAQIGERIGAGQFAEDAGGIAGIDLRQSASLASQIQKPAIGGVAHSSSSVRRNWAASRSFGGCRPRCFQAMFVSTRPRGVRWMKPCWIM